MERRTYLRTHTLQAERLFLDLREAAAELRAQAEGSQDRRAVTLVRESGLSLVLVYLRSGAELREHAAPGPVTVQVFDGRVRIEIEDEQIDASAGQLVAFDAGVRHAVHASEDSCLLLTLKESSEAEEGPPEAH